MNLIVMVGNIGSGKTTFVKEYVARYPKIVVVSRDDLRYMVGAGKYVFNTELEPCIFESAYLMVQSIMRSQKFHVLLDEVNVGRSERADYLRLAQQNNYNPIAVVMPRLDKATSVGRRLQNPHGDFDRKIWENIWDRFDGGYDPPSLEEGFTAVIEQLTLIGREDDG